MEDLGAPSSYLALAEGTDVLSSDGEKLGSVAEQVEQIYERGVVLGLDAAAAEELAEPD